MANITKEKRNWMIGSGVIITLLICFAGAIYGLFFYTGSTKEIVAVADQLQVDPSWKLDSESIHPPQSFCIDVECPSVSRNWITSNPIEKSDLEQITKASGWNLSIDGNCNLDRLLAGSPTGYCEARGVVDEYEVIVAAIGSSSSPDEYRLSLSVVEKN